MPNFLGPYWTRINYHGALAPHSMTIPTRTWSPDGGAGTFAAWDSSAKAADDMLEELITAMLPFFNADVEFDNAVIFYQAAEGDVVQPLKSLGFTGLVGTNTGGSWASAVELQFIARTAAFGLAKLVLLDACSENDFNARTTFSMNDTALFNEWFSATNGWSGRDNSQPSLGIKITTNLNQKLRKEYRYD